MNLNQLYKWLSYMAFGNRFLPNELSNEPEPGFGLKKADDNLPELQPKRPGAEEMNSLKWQKLQDLTGKRL